MTAHREEHEHPLGKIVGTLARGVTADWMGVALVITHAGRITHRNVEAFNCDEDVARHNLIGMLVEAFDFATAQYEEINAARLVTLEECRAVVEQANA